MNLSDWVKSARAHAHLSMQALGDAVGVSKGNVWHWEHGNHQPSYAQLLRMAEVTGYPLLTHDGKHSTGDSADANNREQDEMSEQFEWPFGDHITPEQWKQAGSDLRGHIRVLAAEKVQAALAVKPSHPPRKPRKVA